MQSVTSKLKNTLLLNLALVIATLSPVLAHSQNCVTTNIAAGKTAVANLAESYGPASNVTDGNISTEWISGVDGMKWVYVDLGQAYDLCRAVVKWPQGSAISGIKIQGSNTANNDWVDIKVVASNDWGQTAPDNSYAFHDIDLSTSTVAYRYVRLYIAYAGAWGPKVKEFEIYKKTPVQLPAVSITSPATGTSFIQSTNIALAANASEQGGTISKVEFYQGTTKLGEDLTSPYQFTWSNAPVGDYSITARAYDASNQFTVSDAIDIHVITPSAGWSLTGNVGNATTSFLGTTDNNPLVIKTNGLERMRIQPDGRIAIKTSLFPTDDPNVALAVGGSIYSRKLKVTQATWADYVFDRNYKLPTFQQIEAYINQHHHLPGVPSTSEVQKNGLDVGDNQALLLKKIEELTLYMIEVNKRMDKLEKENATLKHQLQAKKK